MSCIDCGFLAIEGAEANLNSRQRIELEGRAGWFSDDTDIDCYKQLWDWDLGGQTAIITEANALRNDCPGFRQHVPGRSPKDHIALEDEGRHFKREALLAAIAFLGALIGAWLGASAK